MKPIIYLAAPYTHSDPAIREQRYRAVTRAAATLIEQGYVVYSPITMTHPLDVLLAANGATLGSEFWVAYDEAFMVACAEIMVLQLEGWENSSGVTREIEFFTQRDKKVSYLEPEAR